MKTILILSVVMVMVLVFSVQTHAQLQNLGTDSLGNRLIYDSDLDITWYDYTNAAASWQDQMDWADVLSVTFGSSTYSDWRLPILFDESCTTPYNCTNSEMGHLYYTELGNVKQDPSLSFGDFQDLQTQFYWSGTEATNTGKPWFFNTTDGYQNNDVTGASELYAFAVRSGMAVAPEPISSTLFIIGGATLGFRRWRKKRSV